MAGHTPGPWLVDDRFAGCRKVFSGAAYSEEAVSDGLGDEICFTVGLADDEEDLANALRIAACVNACEGIPTEAIEAGGLEELIQAAEQAFAALVGAHAADDSVQGRARRRLISVLSKLNPGPHAKATEPATVQGAM